MSKPSLSPGASEERRAFRTYLGRQILDAENTGQLARSSTLSTVLDWVLRRQERYEAAPGGLGRKRR